VRGAAARARGLVGLVQLGVEPADAQAAIGAQPADLVHVAPDEPGRVARVEDGAEGAGGRQLLVLEEPPPDFQRLGGPGPGPPAPAGGPPPPRPRPAPPAP